MNSRQRRVIRRRRERYLRDCQEVLPVVNWDIADILPGEVEGHIGYVIGEPRLDVLITEENIYYASITK